MRTLQLGEKICEDCEIPFTPHSGRQKWCDPCRDAREEIKAEKRAAGRECERCGKNFRPSGSRQIRCDTCRFEILQAQQPKPKQCQSCGKSYMPNANHQKICEECREEKEYQQRQPIVFADIPCRHCGKMFTPNSNAQKQCGECRSDEKRCVCGSWISGREKWGEHWGGGCDRAEDRVDRLMIALGTFSSR